MLATSHFVQSASDSFRMLAQGISKTKAGDRRPHCVVIFVGRCSTLVPIKRSNEQVLHMLPTAHIRHMCLVWLGLYPVSGGDDL